MRCTRAVAVTAWIALAGLVCTACGADNDAGPDASAVAASKLARSSHSLSPDTSSDAAADPAWSLEARDTTYLWDLEHHSNVLVKFGFAALGDALSKPDRDALMRLLAAGFEGRVPEQTIDVVLNEGTLDAQRHDGAAAPLRAMDTPAFAERLLELRQPFAAPPTFRFAVKRITPSERGDLDAPWSALCVMQIGGTRKSDGGPIETALLFEIEFERPTKERMAAPAWVRAFSILRTATVGSETPLFRKALTDYGIDGRRFHDNWRTKRKMQVPGGIYACDYNRDGCVDLLTTDAFRQGNALLRGKPGGGFDDVTTEAGLLRIQSDGDLDAAFVDLDGDGWEDLVFAGGTIWRNVEGERFEELTDRSNLRSLAYIEGQRSTVTVVDFDRDGRMDLYVVRGGGFPTSWLEDAGESPHRNALLRNVGDWRFEDVTEKFGADGGPRSSFTAVWFDANADLWPDVYVMNEFGDGALYVNEEGARFFEMDVDPTTDDFGSMGAASGDLDNDGNIDLYVAAMYSKAGSRVIGNLPEGVYPDAIMARLSRLISGSELYQNAGDLRFSARAVEYQIQDVGWAWGPALADFDNDGLLDIYATAGYMSRDRREPDG